MNILNGAKILCKKFKIVQISRPQILPRIFQFTVFLARNYLARQAHNVFFLLMKNK
jgi:hypothetical protein